MSSSRCKIVGAMRGAGKAPFARAALVVEFKLTPGVFTRLDSSESFGPEGWAELQGSGQAIAFPVTPDLGRASGAWFLRSSFPRRAEAIAALGRAEALVTEIPIDDAIVCLVEETGEALALRSAWAAEAHREAAAALRDARARAALALCLAQEPSPSIVAIVAVSFRAYGDRSARSVLEHARGSYGDDFAQRVGVEIENLERTLLDRTTPDGTAEK